MSATLTLARDRQDQILVDSVRLQRPLVLTHQSGNGWRTFKALFVSGSPGLRELHTRVRMPEDGWPTNLPAPGATLGGTFRIGHKKCMFGSVLVSTEMNDEEALFTLRWPDQLQQLQRRAYERALPPPGEVIAVRFWRDHGCAGHRPTGDPPLHGATAPESRNVRHGQLEDISAGGMRIKVADPKDMELDCTYRCVLVPRPGKPPLVLDAVLRHREAVDNGRASLGFQFVGMETSAEGLRLLDRIARVVNHFQRAHQRG